MRLALGLARAASMRVVLLTILIAISVVTFVMVTELSRVSTVGLDEAIASDVGETGLYRVHVDSNLGLDEAELTRLVVDTMQPFAKRPLLVVHSYWPPESECPPFARLGVTQVNILYDAALAPVPLRFGDNLPPDSEFCFAGQYIPSSAVYFPTQGEQQNWATGVFATADYQRVLELSTLRPMTRSFLVATGVRTEQTAAVQAAAHEALATAATKYGADLINTVSVSRLMGGESIRAASDGIRVVYNIIGWGVLLLGALGLGAAELIVVRGRSWFYGLSRAVGARRSQIVQLVVADIAIVLVLGVGLAFATAWVIGPAARDFARSAFEVNVTLLNRAAVTRVLSAMTLVLVAAAVVPAVIAARQDPIDALEPRSE